MSASSDTEYCFEFLLPEGFVRLPHPDSDRDWKSAMKNFLPYATSEQNAQASEYIRDHLSLLYTREETVTDVAMFTGTELVGNEERLSAGMLLVAVRFTGHADQLAFAEAIYQAKRNKFLGETDCVDEIDQKKAKGFQGLQDTILATKLPSGPAIASISLRSTTLVDGSGDEHVVAVASLQLIIPARENYAVYFTLTTPSVYLLDSYSSRLATVGKSFKFRFPA